MSECVKIRLFEYLDDVWGVRLQVPKQLLDGCAGTLNKNRRIAMRARVCLRTSLWFPYHQEILRTSCLDLLSNVASDMADLWNEAWREGANNGNHVRGIDSGTSAGAELGMF
jgi:hypothetical protein